ncbi:hypothetical protein Ctha_2668 [Chloroherpeton thalassium ATCC 35110]|uniref:Uncharacterized protein n=1 Tax=Chloroherpeton thalassium (strain ATCC 35110 / GB-78) TaxID=517418 RepID=B3QYP4_CHLT3|nr:hypothetical protein [Chloroherpeton thalassium]ACF15117.1 hypothetical protein Ctha_2668 [Chloroherpeton thalassium ATCC 35110]
MDNLIFKGVKTFYEISILGSLEWFIVLLVSIPGVILLIFIHFLRYHFQAKNQFCFFKPVIEAIKRTAFQTVFSE